MTNEPIDTKKLEVYQSQLETCLDKIENIFLRDAPFLAGDEISIADLLGICELQQPLSVRHDVFRGRPRLDAWAKRVQDRLQPHFHEASAHIYKVKEMFPAPSPKL